MLFPRKEEVFEIHGKLLDHFGGMPGIREMCPGKRARTVLR